MKKTFLFLLIVMWAQTACSPATTQPLPAAPTAAYELPTDNNTPTAQPGADWPQFTLSATLAGALPSAPAELPLYRQAMPDALPSPAELDAVLAQLKVTGEVAESFGEANDRTILVTEGGNSLRLVSTDPLNMVLAMGEEPLDAQQVNLPIQERAQSADTFLKERQLLNFPYRLEVPNFSREAGRAIRVVPLLDGVPLYDFDPLNGRMLVLFNAEGAVSSVFWRALKLNPNGTAKLKTAEQVWQEIQAGQIPSAGEGRCWQVGIYDPSQEFPVFTPISPQPCVTYSSGAVSAFGAATIDRFEWVYFAYDLNLGMSESAFPADSPARLVFPLWRLVGTTDDGRQVEVLWQALAD
ncbi:MAG TPA: hypothetical protein PK299_09230 [Anaerolineales bacterium]|nr:hypothetical protein [Anaerolineales bacterium]